MDRPYTRRASILKRLLYTNSELPFPQLSFDKMKHYQHLAHNYSYIKDLPQSRLFTAEHHTIGRHLRLEAGRLHYYSATVSGAPTNGPSVTKDLRDFAWSAQHLEVPK